MKDFPLNKIVFSESGWTCNVFEFDVINEGGMYIEYDVFKEYTQQDFEDYTYRVYHKTKKIVFSSKKETEFQYCALNVSFQYWKCLLCKKLNKISDSKCFCLTYSTCWTPINGVLSGVYFSNDLDFKYHFYDNTLSNLII